MDSASVASEPPATVTAGAGGHVRVTAQNASNARFFIDDRLVASGAREADLPSVSPDRPHVLRVEADGLVPAERAFTVAAGGMVEIQMTLGSTPIKAPALVTPAPAPLAKAPKGAPPARPHPTPLTKPSTRPARHRDGLVGDDIFDKP